MTDHNPSDDRSRDFRKPRNAPVFLLLRAIYKWETSRLYGRGNKLNYSRYFLQPRPIIHPLKDFDFEKADEVEKRAESFRRELIDKTADLNFTDSKIDQLLARIEYFNYRSWEEIERLLLLPVRNDKFPALIKKFRDRDYIVLNDDERIEINEAIADFIRVINAEEDDKDLGAQIRLNFDRHVAKLGVVVAEECSRYLEKINKPSLMANLGQQALDHTLFIRTNDREIVGHVTLFPLETREFISLKKGKIKNIKDLDIDNSYFSNHYLVASIGYVNVAERKLIISNFLEIIQSADIHVSKIRPSNLCAISDDTNLFLTYFGFVKKSTNPSFLSVSIQEFEKTFKEIF